MKYYRQLLEIILVILKYYSIILKYFLTTVNMINIKFKKFFFHCSQKIFKIIKTNPICLLFKNLFISLVELFFSILIVHAWKEFYISLQVEVSNYNFLQMIVFKWKGYIFIYSLWYTYLFCLGASCVNSLCNSRLLSFGLFLLLVTLIINIDENNDFVYLKILAI